MITRGSRIIGRIGRAGFAYKERTECRGELEVLAMLVEERHPTHKELQLGGSKKPLGEANTLAKLRLLNEKLNCWVLSDRQQSNIHLTLNTLCKNKPLDRAKPDLMAAIRNLKLFWKERLSHEEAPRKTNDENETEEEETRPNSHSVEKKSAKTGPGKQDTLSEMSDSDRMLVQKVLSKFADKTRANAIETMLKHFLHPELKRRVAERHIPFEFTVKNVLQLVITIESELFNTVTLKETYAKEMRERIMLFSHKQNFEHRIRLLDGSISFKEFASKPASYFEEEDVKKMLEEGQDWYLKSVQSDFYLKNVEVLEGEFTCNKCDSKKIHSHQKQTRSADEPMTTFCHCTNCGNRWKMY